MSMPSSLKWRRIEIDDDSKPESRHGHRAAVVRDMIVIFGGGNQKILHKLFVFKTTTQKWFFPEVSGDIPTGRAAYGIASDAYRIIIFGGMMEFGCYSNKIFELNLSDWKWKSVEARNSDSCQPEARLGHSFTMVGNKIYMFGGLTNECNNLSEFIPKYLNDFYVLNLKDYDSGNYQWEKPKTHGTPPSPRESHTMVAFTPICGTSTKLLLYGGMCGKRLGDIWILDLDSMTWTSPVIHGLSPLPRSLHSATIVNRKMYVFGGWIPVSRQDSNKKGIQIQTKWSCSNTLAIFDLDELKWEFVSDNLIEEKNFPKPRAGHTAVKLSSRLYIWSGRDNHRRSFGQQSCCDDLWCLETELPSAPQRTQLTSADTVTLNLRWGLVLAADCYLVQIQKIDPASNSLLFAESQPKKLKSSYKKLSSSDSSIVASKKENLPLTQRTFQTNYSIGSDSSHMSGMEVLVAAATAASKLPHTTKSSSQNIQLIPSQAVQSGVVQNVKMQSNIAQTIRLVEGTKQQILVKSPTVAGPQLMTLVKTSQGTLALTPKISTGQVVKLVTQNSPKPTYNTTATVQSISGEISNSADNQDSQLKMYVLPNRTQSYVLQPQAVPSGQQVSIRLQSPLKSTIKIPASVIKTINESTSQSGQSKLVLSSDGNSSFRIINTPQVLLPTTTVNTSSVQPADLAKIPQLDGFEDELQDAQDITDQWFDVGTFKTNHCLCTGYYVPNDDTHYDPDRKLDSSLESLVDYSKFTRVNLLPSTPYRIRVCALNSLGRSPWGPANSFQTLAPDLPPAPDSVKFERTNDGVKISWKIACKERVNFFVYIAFKRSNIKHFSEYFCKVYDGPNSYCTIPTNIIDQAYIDVHPKPHLIFRIGARSEKGIGPAIQIRWCPNLFP